jgi:hypothetical protein
MRTPRSPFFTLRPSCLHRRVRQRELRQVLAKHSPTTHVSKAIHYPHHPHRGETVTIVRRCSSFGQHQVQVDLPSGDQLVVPEWMLDEELCRSMEIAARPALSLSALVSLLCWTFSLFCLLAACR